MWYELLILLNICHLLADYTGLSTAKMLAAKRFGTPLHPILLHATIHGILQAIVITIYCNNIKLGLLTFIIQTITHFIIDVWKGKMNFYFPIFQSPSNKQHWILFGTDQTFHQLVIIYITKLIVD